MHSPVVGQTWPETLDLGTLDLQGTPGASSPLVPGGTGSLPVPTTASG